MPCYNHEKYIEESFFSIYSQTYNNIEFIIINDGSNDNSDVILNKLIDKYKKRFINLIYINKNNEGLTKSLNLGLSLAKGEFISFIASDDIFYPNKIQNLMDEFKFCDKDIAVLCANVNYINNEGERIFVDIEGGIHLDKPVIKSFADVTESIIYFGKKFNFDFNRDYGKYNIFLKYNHICDLGCIFRKHPLFEVGLYNENVGLEDVDMWLKLSKKYRFKYIDLLVGAYRYHNNNSINIRKKQLLIDKCNIIKNEKDFCNKNNLQFDWTIGYFNLLILLFRSKMYSTFLKYCCHIYINKTTLLVLKKIFKEKLTSKMNYLRLQQ